MSNRFFNPLGLEVIDGTLAQGRNVNQVTDETDAAFDKVQSELDVYQESAEDAYRWGNNDQGDEPKPLEHPGEYSSKAYAQEAAAWAKGTGGVDTTADGVTPIDYSANEKADEAAASASNAATSETNAAASALLASQWAEYTEGTVPTPGGGYSAKYWAQLAAASEANALGYAQAAQNSADLAAASETAAESAKTDAEAAANTANDSKLMAQEWAENPEDVEITNNPGSYSSLHYNEKAKDAKIAAEAAQTASEIARDRSQEWAENPEDDPIYDLGPENITNGQFDANTTGWSAEDATISVVAGECETVYSGDTQFVYQLISGLEIGKTYEVTLELYSDDIVSVSVLIDPSFKGGSTASQALTINGTKTQYNFSFVADDTDLYFQLFTTMTSGQKYYADNISVRGELANRYSSLHHREKAEDAQTAAEAAQAATEAVYDDFDDRYLGPKATDPTLDNDGQALVLCTGTLQVMR